MQRVFCSCAQLSPRHSQFSTHSHSSLNNPFSYFTTQLLFAREHKDSASLVSFQKSNPGANFGTHLLEVQEQSLRSVFSQSFEFVCVVHSCHLFTRQAAVLNPFTSSCIHTSCLKSAQASTETSP